LGKAYFHLEKYIDAKEAFEKARAIGWPTRMLWYQIEPIETYNKLGEYQKALTLASESLIGNPNYAEAHYQSALAYRGLGDEEKYQEELALAIYLDSRVER